MKKSFLITTGGSGGHVIPATILYEHLAKEANVVISIDKRGLSYLDKDYYKFKIINTPKLNNIFLLPFNLIIILLQTFVHIGVNIRLLPTTGMTLPFLSYGGSSIVSTSLIAGIILNLTKRKVD